MTHQESHAPQLASATVEALPTMTAPVPPTTARRQVNSSDSVVSVSREEDEQILLLSTNTKLLPKRSFSGDSSGISKGEGSHSGGTGSQNGDHSNNEVNDSNDDHNNSNSSGLLLMADSNHSHHSYQSQLSYQSSNQSSSQGVSNLQQHLARYEYNKTGSARSVKTQDSVGSASVQTEGTPVPYTATTSTASLPMTSSHSPCSMRTSQRGLSQRGLSRRGKLNLANSIAVGPTVTTTATTIPAVATSAVLHTPPTPRRASVKVMKGTSEVSISAASAAALERVAMHRNQSSRSGRVRGLGKKLSNLDLSPIPSSSKRGSLGSPSGLSPMLGSAGISTHTLSPNTIGSGGSGSGGGGGGRSSIPLQMLLEKGIGGRHLVPPLDDGDGSYHGYSSNINSNDAGAANNRGEQRQQQQQPLLRHRLSPTNFNFMSTTSMGSSTSTITTSTAGAGVVGVGGSSVNNPALRRAGTSPTPAARHQQQVPVPLRRLGTTPAQLQMMGTTGRSARNGLNSRPGLRGRSSRHILNGSSHHSNSSLGSGQGQLLPRVGAVAVIGGDQDEHPGHNEAEAQVRRASQQQQFLQQQLQQQQFQQFQEWQQQMQQQQQQQQQPQLYQPTQEDWVALYNRHVEVLERKDLEIAMKLSVNPLPEDLPPSLHPGAADDVDDAASLDGIELAMEVSRREVCQTDPEEEEVLRMVMEMSRRESARQLPQDSQRTGASNTHNNTNASFDVSFAEASFCYNDHNNNTLNIEGMENVRDPDLSAEELDNALCPGVDPVAVIADAVVDATEGEGKGGDDADEEVDEDLRRALRLSTQESLPLPPLSEEEELERVLRLSEQEAATAAPVDEDEELLRVLRLSQQEQEQQQQQQQQNSDDEVDEDEELLRVLTLSQKEASDSEKERETMELVLQLSRQKTGDGSLW